MSEDHSKKSVVVCDTQPITAQGLKCLLASAGDLEFLASLNSLEAATQLVATRAPDIVIVDKGFGMRAVLAHWVDSPDALEPAAAAVETWDGAADGRIRAWRDYYDWADLECQLLAAGVDMSGA